MERRTLLDIKKGLQERGPFKILLGKEGLHCPRIRGFDEVFHSERGFRS